VVSLSIAKAALRLVATSIMGAEQSSETAPAAEEPIESVYSNKEPAGDADAPAVVALPVAADELLATSGGGGTGGGGGPPSVPVPAPVPVIAEAEVEAAAGGEPTSGDDPPSSAFAKPEAPALFAKGHFSQRVGSRPALLVSGGADTGSPSDGGSRSLPLSHRVRKMLSWRPMSFRLTPRSAVGGRGHTDPKRVFEGVVGLSLHAALNQTTQLRALLSKNSHLDVNARDVDGDRTPLHWAAARGYLPIITLLVSAGADTTLTDKDGKTAADIALAADQDDAYELLKFGPPLEDPKPMTGKEQMLSMFCVLNQPNQLRSMLEGQAVTSRTRDLNARDEDGDRCPIHWAAARGAIECLRMLIEHGANLGALDASSCTAAALAQQLNQRKAHAVLMSAIADRAAKPKAVVADELTDATGATGISSVPPAASAPVEPMLVQAV